MRREKSFSPHLFAARRSDQSWYLPLLFCFSNLGVRGFGSLALKKFTVFKQVKMIVFPAIFPFFPASPDSWKIKFHVPTNEAVFLGFCSHPWLKGWLNPSSRAYPHSNTAAVCDGEALLTEERRTNITTQACAQKLICTSHYAPLGKRLHVSKDNNPGWFMSIK